MYDSETTFWGAANLTMAVYQNEQKLNNFFNYNVKWNPALSLNLASDKRIVLVGFFPNQHLVGMIGGFKVCMKNVKVSTSSKNLKKKIELKSRKFCVTLFFLFVICVCF